MHKYRVHLAYERLPFIDVEADHMVSQINSHSDVIEYALVTGDGTAREEVAVFPAQSVVAIIRTEPTSVGTVSVKVNFDATAFDAAFARLENRAEDLAKTLRN